MIENIYQKKSTLKDLLLYTHIKMLNLVSSVETLPIYQGETNTTSRKAIWKNKKFLPLERMKGTQRRNMLKSRGLERCENHFDQEVVSHWQGRSTWYKRISETQRIVNTLKITKVQFEKIYYNIPIIFWALPSLFKALNETNQGGICCTWRVDPRAVNRKRWPYTDREWKKYKGYIQKGNVI